MIKRLLTGLMIIVSFTGSSISFGSIMGISITLFDIVLLVNIIAIIFENKNKFRIHKTSVQTLVIGVICVLATLIFCVDFMQWVKGVVNTLKILICMLIVIKNPNTEDDVNYFAKCYMYGVLLTIIVSIYEIITGNHIFANYAADYIADEWMYNELLKAPTAFLFNPNNVACVVALGMPWCKFLLPQKWRNNLVSQLVLQLLSLFIIFKTGSRGGILVGLVLIIVSILIEGKDIKHVLKYTSIGLIILICISIKYKDFLLEQLNYASFGTAGELSIFIAADMGRFNSVLEAIKISLQTLGLGCGPWCYEVFHQKVYGVPDSVHFFWVELLACYGIIVTILFFVFFIKSVTRIQKMKKGESESRNYLWVMLAWIPLSIVPPTIFTLYVFWFALSICVAYSNLQHKELKIVER